MSTLIALDPGPSTGVAVFRDGVLIQAHTYVNSPNKAAQYRAIAECIGQYERQDAAVVCETFRARLASVGATGPAIDTMRLTGWIEGLAYQNRLPIVWQDPSYKTAYMTQARSYRHATIHEMDAIAHALAYLARHKYPTGGI